MSTERTTSFFTRLALRLTTGRRELPPTFVERLRQALLEQRSVEGLFTGPDHGAPDLYYTGFGCRCLEVLGMPDLVCEGPSRFADWLRTQANDHELSITDLVSLVEIARICGSRGTRRRGDNMGILTRAVRRVQDRHRVDDRGFSRVAGGPLSTYGTFLGVAAGRVLGLPDPFESATVRRAVREQQRSDGGFAESAQAPASGTSPTAAGIALLWETGDVSVDIAEPVARFLAGLQTASGGFKSHKTAAEADLLSTFTALTALDLIGQLSRIRRGSAVRFARAMLREDGLFAATARDRQTDVEYMYYGIGVMALAAASLTDQNSQKGANFSGFAPDPGPTCVRRLTDRLS